MVSKKYSVQELFEYYLDGLSDGQKNYLIQQKPLKNMGAEVPEHLY